MIVVKVTSCGQTGRMGPVLDQCANELNGTNVEFLSENVLLSIKPSHPDAPISNMRGIQRWTVPQGGYYT